MKETLKSDEKVSEWLGFGMRRRNTIVSSLDFLFVSYIPDVELKKQATLIGINKLKPQ